MELRGTLVRLRPLGEADAPSWLEILNDPAVMNGMDRVAAVDPEQHAVFFAREVAPEPVRWFAIEPAEERRICGGIWLWEVHSRHRRAEVRLFIAPAYAGKGYGSEAISLCANYAFESLGLHKLYAYVHRENEASARAFLRAGFFEEATLREEAVRSGRYADVTRFAKIAPR